MDRTGALPHTTHTIPHSQRARLIRSTRKLEAILGETPLFLDTSVPAASYNSHASASSPSRNSTDPRRPVFIFAASPTRTSSPSASATPGPSPLASPASSSPTTLVARPVLLLRFPQSAAASEFSDLATPMSPVFSIGSSTSTSTDESSRWRRMRKMAKLAHTLGEPVPLELVFPPGHRERRSSTLSTRRRSRTSSFRGHTPALASAARARKRLDSGADSASLYSTLSGEQDEDDVAPAPSPPTADAQLARSGTHRREREWSGEWAASDGVQSMDDIVNRLRGLRVK